MGATPRYSSSARVVEVPAKWILLGEHSVIRGGTAVAFQHPHFKMKLTYDGEASSDFRILGGEQGANQAIQKILVELGVAPRGTLHLESTIPMSSGLGSSAALCVGLTRIFAEELGLAGENEFEVARRCENVFHGKSSGLDIAAVSATGPICFRSGEFREIQPSSTLGSLKGLQFRFHDTGLRSSTRTAVQKVQDLGRQDLDQEMSELAQRAASLLESSDSVTQQQNSLGPLMNRSFEIFREWGLVFPAFEQQRDELIQSGALGVRLTGSGLGGFLVSLWKTPGL
jgi:mevalonate kinase